MEKARITKQMVLEGLEYRREVEIPQYPDVIFVLGPMSDSEWAQVKAKNMEYIVISKEAKIKDFGDKLDLSMIDLPKMILGDSKFLAVSFCLSRGMGKAWTVADLQNLKIGACDALYEYVDEICGLTEEMRKTAEGFRGRPKGKK